MQKWFLRGLIFWMAVGTAVAPMRAAEGRTVPGHVVAAAARLAPVRRLEPGRRLQLAIGLPVHHQAELNALLQELYDPASPEYHHYLTVQQFTERFGPTAEEYSALAAFASSNGLRVVATRSNRLVLDVEGAVAAVEQALHTRLQVYRHPVEGREFYAPESEPGVSAALPIQHIAGLDNYSRPRAMCRRSPDRAGSVGTPTLGSGYGGSYLGNDFRAAYVPGVPLTGTGQKVGLLEFDAGFSQSDMSSYETLAGLPNIPVTAVLLDGYDGELGNDNSEVSLDIEMAMAMAPGLDGVLVYEGTYTDDILSQMASDDQANQLSASWSYATDAETEVIFQEFAAQGQSFFNASGDGDAWAGAISSSCDDTNITIVGGTTLYTAGPGGSWRTESVWNEGYDPPGWSGTDNGYWGSGGGISTTYVIPAWQEGIDMTASQGSTTMRNIPDVAMTADNIFVTYSNGLSGTFMGTSCAAPLWAGLTALINEQSAANGYTPVGFLNPILYSIGESTNYGNCFHDTVVGNNTNRESANQFFAVSGYDLCTGWGTPAGEPLIDALAPDALAITPGNGLTSAGWAGGPFTNSSLAVTLANQSAASFSWACVNNLAWVTVVPTNGTLAPGQSPATVTVGLNAAATNLGVGVYSGVLWFTNFSDGIGQQRAVRLAITKPETTAYGSAVLSLQPAAYWPLNETTVPPPAEVASNAGALGIFAKGFAFSEVGQGQAGIVNQCVRFTNSSLVVAGMTAHIDVPYLPALNPSGPFTVEFWAKPNQSPNDYFCPISSVDDTQNGGSSRYGWVIYEAAGNEWTFRLGNGDGYVLELVGGTVDVGAWQHIVGVFDGANATLYVNGVAVDGPSAATGYAPNANSMAPLRMGGTSFGNRTFDGWVDEVAVYTNALSQTTIQAHYQAATSNNPGYSAEILASDPAGYWRLDEPVYTAVAASTLPMAVNLGSLSSAADGTYLPGTTPGVAGVAGAGFGTSNLACAFGADSAIDVPGMPVAFTGPLTVSAWVKSSEPLAGSESVLNLGAGAYALTVDSGGYPHFVDGTQDFGSLAATNWVTDGDWHNLTGVYDGTNSEYLYVDGELANSNTNATEAPVMTVNDLWIGGDPDSDVFEHFYGTIDEVAIWRQALTPGQVLWVYSAGENLPRVEATLGTPRQNTVFLEWTAVPGLVYQVEYATNLIAPTWTPLGVSFTATTNSVSVEDTLTSGQRFYRLGILPGE